MMQADQNAVSTNESDKRFTFFMIEGAREEMMIRETKRSPERIESLKAKKKDNVTVEWREKFRVSKVMGRANDTK